LKNRQKEAIVLSRVADLMRSANLSDEALAFYRKAIDLAANDPQYREYLGEYLLRLDR
jgi:predicted RNA polymerase sigma factor